MSYKPLTAHAVKFCTHKVYILVIIIAVLNINGNFGKYKWGGGRERIKYLGSGYQKTRAFTYRIASTVVAVENEAAQ